MLPKTFTPREKSIFTIIEQHINEKFAMRNFISEFAIIL